MTGRQPASGRFGGSLRQTCSFGVLVGALLLAGSAEAATTTIKSGSTVSTSTLAAGDTGDFEGGTLKVDSATIPNAFTLGNVPTNTIDASGATGTFTGIFSGTGPLTITDSVGGGNVVFTATNTYTGPTTINAGGTLSLSGTGSIASTSLLTANGTFDISATTSGATLNSLAGSGAVNLGGQSLTLVQAADTFSGVISGAGGSLVINGGTETLAGNNTYTGGTTITRGTLQLGNGGAAGSVVGDIADQGTLVFNRSDVVTFGNVISGAGSVVDAGGGTITFTAAQTYTGATTINTGVLALSGSGSIAASSGLTANGTFDISALASGASLTSLSGTGAVRLGTQLLTLSNATGTFSGVISGGGGLTLAAGTEILAGTNTYTGATTIAGGTLQLGNGGASGSVIGNIADSGTLAFDLSGSTTYNSVVSGTGALSQIGSGTLTLSAAQTYTGLTTITAGTLALSGSGDISASGGVVDNGTLSIGQTNALSVNVTSLSGSGAVTLGTHNLQFTNASGTFSGIVSGTGGIVMNGGTQTLSGVNTFTGTATISVGTLALSGNGGISHASKLIDNGTFDISATTQGASITSLSGNSLVALGAQTLTLTSASDTFSGGITGIGGGITLSAGNETLSGPLSYTGATTVNAGKLTLTGATTLATSDLNVKGTLDATGLTNGTITSGSLEGTGTVNLGANRLDLTNASGTFSGTLITTGGLQLEAGTEIITNTQSYSGGTHIVGGTLQIGNGTNGGGLPDDIEDDGNLAIDRSGSLELDNIVSGSGTLTQMGGGTTVIVVDDTYTGGTIIDTGGTLQIGSGTASGSIVGNVTDNGTFTFDRSDAVTFGGIVSGTGNIEQMGADTLTLTAANTYTGTTTIDATGTLALSGSGSIAASQLVVDKGVLDLSAATGPNVDLVSLAGSGSVVLGAQSLTLTQATGTFNGVIGGTGGVSLTGGDEILGGSNTYTGATAIGGGKLEVNGSIASSSGVTVNSGGTLLGTGTVSALTVNSGGAVTAGSGGAPGTLTVAGAANFASGSTYTVNVSAAGASKLVVSGAANLAGTLALSSSGGTVVVGQKFTVLSAANGITGTFTLAPGTLNSGAYSFKLSYDANDVFLAFQLAALSPLLPSSATQNEKEVTHGIDDAIAKGTTLPDAFEALGNLSPTALAGAASQLSGEVASDLPQLGASLMSPFLGAVFDRIDTLNTRSGAPSREPAAWLSVFGDQGSSGGQLATTGAHGVNANGAGVVAGADMAVMSGLTAGFALSAGSANLHLSGSDADKARAEGYQLAGYGHMRFSPHIYGTLALAVAVDDVKTSRPMTVSGADTLTGSFSTVAFGMRYETGLYFSWITPYFAVQDELFRTPAYAESAVAGAGQVFALTYDGRLANSTSVELGAGKSGDINLGNDMTLNLLGRVAYLHEFTPPDDIGASFTSLAASDFTVQGSQLPRNYARISTGAGFTADRFSFKARVNTVLGAGAHSVSGTAAFGYVW